MRDTLCASHADEKGFHDKVFAELQKQYQKLQDRIDAMYVDKLDGNLSDAYFEEKSTEWRKEQADTRRKIEVHEQANQSYIEESVQLLELADKSYDLYPAQCPEEQRRLRNCVASHATWGNGSLALVYRPPFDLIAHSNREYANKHKGSDDFEAKNKTGSPDEVIGRTHRAMFRLRMTLPQKSLRGRFRIVAGLLVSTVVVENNSACLLIGLVPSFLVGFDSRF